MVFESCDDSRRINAWSRYWATGVLHSCPGSFAENYSGGIAEHWRRELGDARFGKNFLEVGSGNGALAHFFCRFAPPAATLDAIDIAEIAPSLSLSECGDRSINFHTGTRMEAMPFPDDRFDVLIGQFSVEYTDAVSSIRELARVFKRDGYISLIMHHASSRFMGVAREDIKHLDHLLRPGGLLTLAERLLPFMYLSKTQEGRERLRANAEAQHTRSLFNDEQCLLDRLISESVVPDQLLEGRNAITRVLSASARVSLPSAIETLGALRQNWEDARWRGQELLQAGVDDPGRASWEAVLSQHFTVIESDWQPLYHNGDVLIAWAWRVRVKKCRMARKKPAEAKGRPAAG